MKNDKFQENHSRPGIIDARARYRAAARRLRNTDVKYPSFLSDFNEAWIFLVDFRQILEYQISWKSVLWESSCFLCGQTDGRTGRQADRQTWRRKKSLFAKLRKAPKIAALTDNATQSNRCACVTFKRCSQSHLTIFQVPSFQQGANWCRTEKLTVSFLCRNCYVIKNCIQFCCGLENITWVKVKI